MKLLAVETATEACSVALFLNGSIDQTIKIAPREHTQLLLPMIDDLLAKHQLSLSDLDALAFGEGPGSFTGLRLSAGMIQGLAYAANKPVVPVSTLAALAHGAYRKFKATRILVALDARADSIYWAAYHVENEKLVMQSDVRLDKIQNLSWEAFDQSYVGVGTAFALKSIQNLVAKKSMKLFEDCYPEAYDIAELAVQYLQFNSFSISALQVLPQYFQSYLNT